MGTSVCSAVSYFTAWFGKHVLDTWIQSYGNEEKKTVGIRSCSKDFQIDDLSPPHCPRCQTWHFLNCRKPLCQLVAELHEKV